MVRVKTPPRHADVRPLKCVVYIKWNPVQYIVQWHHEWFQQDQRAWEQRHMEAYKQHVHCPPKDNTTAAVPLKASDS